MPTSNVAKHIVAWKHPPLNTFAEPAQCFTLRLLATRSLQGLRFCMLTQPLSQQDHASLLLWTMQLRSVGELADIHVTCSRYSVVLGHTLDMYNLDANKYNNTDCPQDSA